VLYVITCHRSTLGTWTAACEPPLHLPSLLSTFGLPELKHCHAGILHSNNLHLNMVTVFHSKPHIWQDCAMQAYCLVLQDRAVLLFCGLCIP